MDNKPKMCISRKGNRKLNIWINQKSSDHLGFLNKFYAKALKREVSDSLIVRRALGALFDSVGQSVKDKDLEAIYTEAVQLARHIR